MKRGSVRCILAMIVIMLPVAACAASAKPSPPTPSSPPAASEQATFDVKQMGSDGPEVTVLIFDPTGSLTAARGATEEDEMPFIPSEVEPRIGAVPNDASKLRVLWGGGPCDTTYTVTLSTNSQGGFHIVVERGPLSNPACDALGILRGVVLTFENQVDTERMSGSFRNSGP